MEARRRGKFSVSRELLHDYETAARVMRGLVIWHSETNMMQDAVTYWGEHAEFKPVLPGSVPPEYTAIVTDDAVTWRPVEDQPS